MIRKALTLFALVALILAVVGGTGCNKLKARAHLNDGVQMYKNAKYPEAVEHFKQAVQLDPNFTTARLYLANAYYVQYIPGAESEDNVRLAEAAKEQYLKVLELDPNNTVALASMAKLYFDQKKMDEAQKWYQKLLSVNPKDKEALYTLGVIAWTESYPARMEVRAKLGMKPEDPGPIKDKKAREALREKNLPIIEAGMKYLQQALEIDPEYDDAMAYMNLLYRERADLAESPEGYKKDIEVADNWVQKTLETKKIKAARAPKAGGVTAEQPAGQ
jgi:tetratricopeptide (TPR) repeat protein